MMEHSPQQVSEQELFAHAFEYAAIGMMLIDREGYILKTNSSLRRTLGYAAQDIHQHKLWSLLHPDEMSTMQALLDPISKAQALTSADGSSSIMREYRFLHKRGWYLRLQMTLSPVTDDDGMLQYWIMQLQNVSDKQYTEKPLRVSNDRIVKVIERINDIFFVLDQNWKFIYMNRRTEQWFHKERSELLGKCLWDVLAPQDVEGMRDRFQTVCETKDNDAFELYLSTKKQWYQIDLYPGRESLSIYLKDIHKFKEVEEALAKSEEGFRQLAEHSTDMIARLDEQGVFLYVSPICEHMLGYKREDMIGTSVQEYVHGEDGELWDALENDRRSFSEISTITYRIRDHSGDYLWFETTYRWILVHDKGQARQLIAVSRDISERKKMERELIEANDRLSKLSAIDPLTGIANRRIFEEFYVKEWKRASRTRRSIALIMLDVDHFKLLNDTYGHTYGDDCLKQVAQAIQSALKRPMDMVARYGGEEFAVILPETDTKGAIVVAEEIRKRVEQLQLPHAAFSVHRLVTVSIGLASCLPDQDKGARDLLMCADQALYAAKHAGRNCMRIGELSAGDDATKHA